jgi:hypothetical protein
MLDFFFRIAARKECTKDMLREIRSKMNILNLSAFFISNEFNLLNFYFLSWLNNLFLKLIKGLAIFIERVALIWV